jgi:hypothetical protein
MWAGVLDGIKRRKGKHTLAQVFSFSASGCHEENNFALPHPSAMMFCLTIGPETMQPTSLN